MIQQMIKIFSFLIVLNPQRILSLAIIISMQRE